MVQDIEPVSAADTNSLPDLVTISLGTFLLRCAVMHWPLYWSTVWACLHCRKPPAFYNVFPVHFCDGTSELNKSRVGKWRSVGHTGPLHAFVIYSYLWLFLHCKSRLLASLFYFTFLLLCLRSSHGSRWLLALQPLCCCCYYYYW